MNVVIAGGGVAGMTAAAVLRRLPFVKSIVLFEPFRSQNVDSGEAGLLNSCESETKLGSCLTSVSHHYNGLWSPAITCLQSLGIYSHISKKLHAVRQSGYKDVSGRWLAQPAAGLQEPPASPSLAFIENDQLLSALRRSVLSSDASCCTVDIRWGVRVTDVTRSKSSQYVTVTDSSAESHRADLLVAADGTYSTVFSSLYPHSSNKPLSRGYSVYRGYTEKPPADLKGNDESDSVRHCSYGFQTWGPSARFACVPTVTGNAWYIAVPDTVKKAGAVHPAPAASSSSSLHHDIVTDSSSHEGTGTASRADSSSGAFSGPFSNESVRVGQEEFDTLKKRFQGWHDPVSDILRDTVAERDALGVLRGTGVRVCAARAFSAKSTISAAYAMGHFAPVVFIGDAAHTLDPILAQGAGLAVEDASLLGTALQNNYRHTSYDSFTVTSYGEKEDRKGGGGGEEEMGYLFQRDAHTVHIKNFLLDFEDSRRYRLRKLEFFSEVSQLLGQVESPLLCSVRDTCIYYVPQAFKGVVFDLFIQAVASSEATNKQSTHTSRRSKKRY